MSSSELSNALNPYINQSKTRPTQPQCLPTRNQDSRVTPQLYFPHRSELEFAFAEPPPPDNAVKRRQPTATSIQAVQELLRIVTATRDSQEAEQKRRITWEQEQEAKFTQKQAEMERLIVEMRQEISVLRSNPLTQSSSSIGLLTPQGTISPLQPASPISPISQPPYDAYPPFIQGSSDQSLISHHDDLQISLHPDMLFAETSVPSVSPSPSPQLTCVQPFEIHDASPLPTNPRKRGTSHLSSDDEEENDSSDSSSLRPIKRINHHDKRCITIHAALRKHILSVMELGNDKDLPDSHTEGVHIGYSDPVRFVWEKTTKQSVNNAHMKARILSDIKMNRAMYKHVPDKEFSKKILEPAFEAVYTTMRQKFRGQRDKAHALQHKKRADSKAQKVRHLSRRKMKLSNRSEARMKIDAFAHTTFDGAFQLDCLSSEESDQECDSYSSGMLRTRGYSWRSSRLLRFYEILDDEDKSTIKPKRGIGRKERYRGPPKEGFHLPPAGVATWMISRQWMNTSQMQYQDFSEVLAKRVHDTSNFNWDEFGVLGDESDVTPGEV